MERSPRPLTVARGLVTLLLAATLAVSGASPEPAGAPAPAEAGPAPSPEVVRLQDAATPDGPVAYCGNADVDQVPSDVSRVVVVVHGLGGDACPLAAAALTNAGPGTVVIAPVLWPVDRDHVAWRDASWTRGDPARPARGHARPGPSSFTLLDDLIARSGAADPNGPDLVVAGFSAGGQTVNRYAATTRTPVDRYLIMSPSSYLWLDADRPHTSWGHHQLCADHNDYKYGLDHREGYASRSTDDEIIARYTAAHITYLVGGADDRPTARGLDHACAAEAQGTDRLSRFRNLQASLTGHLDRRTRPRHRFHVIPGVAHDGRALLRTRAAHEALTGQ